MSPERSPELIIQGSKTAELDNLAANANMQKGSCHICGEMGHFARECPRKHDSNTCAARCQPGSASVATLQPLSHPPAFGAARAALCAACTAFDAACTARFASAYPPGLDGCTLYEHTHFFAVARRPSLLEVYSEYAAYHDHQLTKGWKS